MLCNSETSTTTIIYLFFIFTITNFSFNQRLVKKLLLEEEKGSCDF